MKILSEMSLQLEAERRKLKLDYRVIAERCGLTQLSVRSVLQGKTAPRITTLMAIADQLGLEVLLLPKIVAAGLKTPTDDVPEPALSRVDRIVAETTARYLVNRQDDSHEPST